MRILNNLPNPTAPTTERPDGQLKDVSAPAAGDGTPAREDWLNDAYYALLALMDAVGISADDSDEEFEAGSGASQFLSAMRLFAQEWAYPGQDQGLKDISAGNQTTDITAFEAGGGSEKEDGFTVRAGWTGGDGVVSGFGHTLVSAYTVGNQMAGFITANLWKGEGAGELILRLDKTNSKWLVLTPGIWDSGSNTTGEWEKRVDKSMLQTWDRPNRAFASTQVAGTTWTFPVLFVSTAYKFTGGAGGGGGSAYGFCNTKAGLTKTTAAVGYGSVFPIVASTDSDDDLFCMGFWA